MPKQGLFEQTIHHRQQRLDALRQMAAHIQHSLRAMPAPARQHDDRLHVLYERVQRTIQDISRQLHTLTTFHTAMRYAFPARQRRRPSASPKHLGRQVVYPHALLGSKTVHPQRLATCPHALLHHGDALRNVHTKAVPQTVLAAA